MENQTEVEVVSYIQEALQKYELPDKVIESWKTEYMPLAVTDLKDTVMYTKIREARLFIKSKRISVDKRRKELKEDSLKFGKAVDSEAKRLIALLEPIEEHLLAEEKKVDDEKERVRAEKERIEKEKIQRRTKAMIDLGMTFDGVLFKYHEYEIEFDKLMRLEESDFLSFRNIAIAEVGNINQRLKQEEEEKLKVEEVARLEVQKKEEEEKEKKLKAEEALRVEREKKEASIKAEEHFLQEEKERMRKVHAAKEKELKEKEKFFAEYEAKLKKEREELEQQKVIEEKKEEVYGVPESVLVQAPMPKTIHELINQLTILVAHEYKWEEEEDQDYGTLPTNAADFFGEIDLITHCEPEDAIWGRDLQQNFYVGVRVGIRNTVKVLKENPHLLKALIDGGRITTL